MPFCLTVLDAPRSAACGLWVSGSALSAFLEFFYWPNNKCLGSRAGHGRQAEPLFNASDAQMSAGNQQGEMYRLEIR